MDVDERFTVGELTDYYRMWMTHEFYTVCITIREIDLIEVTRRAIGKLRPYKE